MKLYAIRDWNTHYENSRTRNRPQLPWVPVPNRFDGDHYTAIMGHKDGAVIFSGFMLMVEAASHCVPRGTLVRSNGQPHTAKTLSVKCRCPETWFVTALSYLEQHTDWLLITHVADGPSVSDTPLSPARQPPVTELCRVAPAGGIPVSQRITCEKELVRVEASLKNDFNFPPQVGEFANSETGQKALTAWKLRRQTVRDRRAELIKLLGMTV